MNSKKARFEEIGSDRFLVRICVVNIRRDRFSPDPRQLKKKKSVDLKDPTDLVQH